MPHQSRYGDTPHGLMFHHFHGGGIPPTEGSLGAEQFRSILTYVGLRRIWPAEEWLKKALDGTLPPGAVCVTLDDGSRGQLEVAWPVLRDLNLTAFWFPHSGALVGTCDQLELYRYIRNYCFSGISEFYEVFEQQARQKWEPLIESGLARFRSEEHFADCPFFSEADIRFRYLRDEVLGPARYGWVMEQLRLQAGVKPEALAAKLFIHRDDWRALIRAGNVIGLHSHTHPTRMMELPPAEQAREYAGNVAVLGEQLDYRAETVAHPCGSFSEVTLNILRELGVHIGFCADMRRPDGRGLRHPRQNHATILVEMTDPVAALPPRHVRPHTAFG